MTVNTKHETVKIKDCSPLEKNPRRHNDVQITELKKSLEMFGQYRPLVIDENGKILAGNGMFQAMTELGWKEANAIRMIGLTETQKNKLILADNKIYELGANDYNLIDEIILTLDDLEVPGYDPEMLKNLMLSTEQALSAAQNYGVLDEPVVANNQTISSNVQSDLEVARTATMGNAGQPVIVPDAKTGQQHRICPTCGQSWEA